MTTTQPASERPAPPGKARVSLVAGVLAAALMLALPVPAGMAPEAWRTAAVAVLMAIWWAGEAIPLAATALLPLVLFPLLGIADIRAASAPFANPLIYLFLGGFLIALTVERWQLHKRIALIVIARAGAGPRALIGGAMLATAFLSMWISNTATTLMMVPIAISLVSLTESDANARPCDGFAPALMLGIAYAASIGGLATLVGTPPNAFLAAFMSQTYGIEVGFAQWLAFALPVSGVMLLVTWWLLTRRLDDAGPVVPDLGPALAPMSVPEKRTAALFALTAILWIARPLLVQVPGLEALTDPGIAVFAGTLAFIIPAGGTARGALIDWDTAKRLPWGILLLFGGGLSLAAAISTSGLATAIGSALSIFASWPPLLLAAVVVAVIIFLTELTSNTATTAAFLPIVGALAVGAGDHPLTLAAPAAVAASCAFMLPVATPPNAIVYASGTVRMAQMMRAGLRLNLIGIAVIATVAALLLDPLFN